MTEKRFEEQNLENHLNRIYDAKKGKVVFDEDIVDLLNALHEENIELQGMYDAQRQLYCQLNSNKNNIWQDYQDLKKENEQLKQFKEDVFNTIDMHLRMLPTARDNEFNEDDGDPSLYTGAIYMLETLKKELLE